jgi:hypothetical protein
VGERLAGFEQPREPALVDRLPQPHAARFRSVDLLKSIRGEQAQPIANALRVIRHTAHVVDQLVPEDGRNPEFILDTE